MTSSISQTLLICPYIWNGKKRGKGQKNITIKKFFNDKDPKTLTLKECQNAITSKLK